jgi:type VI secretion system protein ImpF
MARTDRDPNMVPSLLDRLLDDQPEDSQEPASSRSQTVRQLEKSVARDLEALLNTRRETLEDLSEDFKEVTRSLINYGLPDFTSFSLAGEKDRTRIRRALEEAITYFEPRLHRVRVTLEAPKGLDRALRFRVDALLRVEPAPEPVTFDAVLQLQNQEYRVQGHG